MRKKSVAKIGGARSHLYLATRGGEILGEPLAIQPYQYASAGSAALKVEEQAVETQSTETKAEKGYPQRPKGVSDQHLYEAWLLMNTPVGSVAGSKVKTPEGNVLRRVPHSKSYRHRPKAFAIGDVVSIESAYVIPLQEYINRISASAESRYKKGVNSNSNVDIHYNKAAMKWVQEVHAHRVSIATDIVKSIAMTAELTQRGTLDNVVELRRLERIDEPDAATLALIEKPAPVVETNASVSANDSVFVGPTQQQDLVNFVGDIPLHAYNDYKEVDNFYHHLKRKELHEVFAQFGDGDIVVTVRPKLAEEVEKHSQARGKVALRFLAFSKIGKRKLSDEGKRKFRSYAKAWEGSSSNALALAANERQVKFQYKVRGLRQKNNPTVVTSPYTPMPMKQRLALFANAQWLPGHHSPVELVPTSAPKAEVLPNGFVGLDQKSIDTALLNLSDRIEQSYNAAKHSVKTKYEKIKAVLFGKTYYNLTPGGILVPTGEATELPWLA